MNSLWLSYENIKNLDYKTDLKGSLNCDVTIIGGGIFGVTCAYYLSKLGYKTVILEKFTIGSRTTGHTTGKITSLHGLFYDYLINSFDSKFAKDYLDVNEKAIENIKNIIDENNINCDFKYQNNYIYAKSEEDLLKIKKEINAVSSLDYNCEFVSKTSLPFDTLGSICFKNQAQFHPLKYLEGLCKSILENSGEIYINTTVTDVKNDGDNYITFTPDAKICSKYVIVASHYPFINFPGFYFTKMYQSTSYLIAIDPKKTLPNGMYISASEPYLSFRTATYDNKELLLIGGMGHKTGYTKSENETYGKLEEIAKKYYPDSDVLFRWNTNDCISLDKLPYIGSYSSLMPNVFVGTGFKKWGMTLSNVAANIIVDQIQEKENKYEYLFNSHRLKPIKNIDEFKNMLVDSSNSLLFRKLETSNLDFFEIPQNSGGIIEINNEKVGVYKDNDGNIHAIKPICTHLGCLLSWNDTDKTWDCPCHGSRYDFDGNNLYNPAFKDLEKYDL